IRTIKDRWERITERVTPQLMTATQVQEYLNAAGAPSTPIAIGIDWERFHKTYFQAPTIRARYTIFDVLIELGVYEEVVTELFSPSGFWGKHIAMKSGE
ncbi:MAG: sn-glycerol-1-phosphate dehydrogenase, partial [Actinobacteria bacterium]